MIKRLENKERSNRHAPFGRMTLFNPPTRQTVARAPKSADPLRRLRQGALMPHCIQQKKRSHALPSDKYSAKALTAVACVFMLYMLFERFFIVRCK